jgi:hypothetical protein
VWIPRIVGWMILLQALMTDYELGVIKAIPMRMHLMADYIVAAFLVISPWLFGFGDRFVVPTATLVVAGFWVGVTTLMTAPRGGHREVTA